MHVSESFYLLKTYFYISRKPINEIKQCIYMSAGSKCVNKLLIAMSDVHTTTRNKQTSDIFSKNLYY